MGFQVVSGSPHIGWFPVDATDTLYVGQIVTTYNKAGCYQLLLVSIQVITPITNLGVLLWVQLKRILCFNTTYKTRIHYRYKPSCTDEGSGRCLNLLTQEGISMMYVQVALLLAETILTGIYLQWYIWCSSYSWYREW